MLYCVVYNETIMLKLLYIICGVVLFEASVNAISSQGSRCTEGVCEDGRLAIFELANWLRENGGVVHEGLFLSENEQGLRGLYTSKLIPKQSTLISAPLSLLIGNPAKFEDQCMVLNKIEQEIIKGKLSNHWPYFRADDSLNSKTPGLWEPSTFNFLQGLEPTDSPRHIFWLLSCRKIRFSNDNYLEKYESLPNTAKQSLWIYITRSADVGLIPIYDLANHDNGKINTIMIRSDDTIYMNAATDIQAGQEIFNTYGFMSTPEIFRDYGFIEPYPRVWPLKDKGNGKKLFIVLLGTEKEPVWFGDEKEFIDVFNPQGENAVMKNRMEFLSGIAEARIANQSLSRLSAVLTYVMEHLASLPTTLEEDKEKIHFSSNMRSEEATAIHYRIEYKGNLEYFVDFIQDEIRKRS